MADEVLTVCLVEFPNNMRFLLKAGFRGIAVGVAGGLNGTPPFDSGDACKISRLLLLLVFRLVAGWSSNFRAETLADPSLIPEESAPLESSIKFFFLSASLPNCRGSYLTQNIPFLIGSTLLGRAFRGIEVSCSFDLVDWFIR